ncbi:MAG: ROK family protein [Blastocatellia bacterium]|nr:ROK family protein [Blastocatellia bacterium]
MSQNSGHNVGIELSTDSLCCVMLDGSRNVAERSYVRLRKDDNPLTQVIEVVESTQEKHGPFATLGLAMPGLIDRGTNRVIHSTYFPEQTNGNLTQTIASAAGVEVLLENDANAAAYGEFRMGVGRGCENMFYAMLQEGIGGAFIINGQLWRGAGGFAGEFGSVAVDSEGTRLEDVASSANIVRRTRERVNRDSTSMLGRREKEDLRVQDIIEAAKSEDDFAIMMLERTGAYVGTAIATVINLLNPERIVIGGDIAEAGDLVMESLINKARSLSFTRSFEHTKIAAGELGKAAAAIGVALLASE